MSGLELVAWVTFGALVVALVGGIIDLPHLDLKNDIELALLVFSCFVLAVLALGACLGLALVTGRLG